jgi:transcription elongation factor Elf1
MRIDLTCAECGKNRFSIDDAQDDASVVFCKDCGHIIGTLGELKSRVADEVMRQVANDNPA